MSGRELDDLFIELEQKARSDVKELDDDGEEKVPDPSPDLYDRANLDLYFLLEEFKRYPNIPVLVEPVEQWSMTRLRDIRIIRYAHSKARDQEQSVDDALSAMKALKDPTEWGGPR